MILVTGATGFLGTQLCDTLQKRNLSFVKTSCSLGLDLRGESATIAFFKEVKPDVVLNCAAFIGGVHFGYEHAAEMFRNNMLMELSLLEACRQSGVRRLVNPLGSCSYPGTASVHVESEFWDGPLHESVQAYGIAKKAFCIGSWAYEKQYSLSTINLVFSGLYGPHDHFDEVRSHAVGALIMKFVRAKRENLPSVTVWGTGKPIREWLHVNDACEAMLRAMDIPAYNDIINVGVSKGYSISETAQMISDIVGYTGSIVYDTTKMDGAFCKTVDGSLCREKLGWTPEISFEQGLENTVKWYMESKQ